MPRTLTLTVPMDPGSAPLDPMETLREWIAEPETRAAFQRMAERLARIVEQDTSVLLPTPPEGERYSLSQWLASYREHFSPDMEALFQEEFPTSHALLRPDTIQRVVQENVWPEVAPAMETLFVRALAAAWAHEHIGDAVRVTGEPTREADRWVVPIGLPKYGDSLGKVILDAEGNVLPQLSTSKNQMRETLRGAA